jgi:hypothetical protein
MLFAVPLVMKSFVFDPEILSLQTISMKQQTYQLQKE